MANNLHVVSHASVLVGSTNTTRATMQPATQKGQRRKRYTIDQLQPEVQPEFLKYGSVAVNAKRFTATLAPFENLDPSEVQYIFDQSFPNSSIVVEEKTPYYEVVSHISCD